MILYSFIHSFIHSFIQYLIFQEYKQYPDIIMLIITSQFIIICYGVIQSQFYHSYKMSHGNYSRNMADLLRYAPPEVSQPYRTPKSNKNPQQKFASKPAQQLSEDDILMLEPPTARKSFRMKSSRKNYEDDHQIRNYSQTKKQPNIYHEHEIGALSAKLQQIVEYYDQRHLNLENNLVQRLNGLESLVMRQMPKIDNTSLLKNDVIYFKQNIQELWQQHEAIKQSIQGLKAKVSKRNSNYPKAVPVDQKQKQKMTVLFMEVVRVSDALEKIEKNVGASGQNYQARIQELQFKLRNSEKTVANLTQNNFSGNQLLSKFGDKVMDRLQTAQNNLLILGKEKVKDKEKINDLINQNDRMSKDIESLLRSMQGDFQNKLDQRISDAINKLINEHESRVNAQEELRRNIDMRERMNQERRASQKQQLMARYQSMDFQIKNELTKKEESIKILQNQVQNEFKNIQKLISSQNHNRKVREIQLQNQIKRIQENFRKEYDIYKSHNSDVIDKIGDLVREEVQVRVNSEINLKKLTSQIATELINDINSVRENSQSSHKQLNMSIKEVIADSSEKFNQISHYVDDQVRKVAEVVTQRYNKMKNVFNKIAIQLKQHLTTTESNRKTFEGRLTTLQDNFYKLKEEVSGEIDEFYTDLDNRLKQQKQYVQTFVFKKTNDLSIKLAKLEEQSGQQISLIKGNIQESKEMISKKMVKSREGRAPESQQEMKQLRTIVFNVKSLTEQLRAQNQDTLQRLKQEIRQRQSENRQQNYNKENQMLQKIQKNNTDIVDLYHKNDELGNKLNSILADGNSNHFYSQEKLKKLSEDVGDMQSRIKRLQSSVAERGTKNEEQIQGMKKVLVSLKGS